MLTVKEYLIAAGLDVDPSRIKLVKHVNHYNRSIRQIIDEGYKIRIYVHYGSD